MTKAPTPTEMSKGQSDTFETVSNEVSGCGGDIINEYEAPHIPNVTRQLEDDHIH